MKKLLALMLAMAMVFGLVACGGSDSGNSDIVNDDDSGITEVDNASTKTVGTDIVGYVTVPEDWLIKLDGIQFQTASPDMNSYITLFIFEDDWFEIPEDEEGEYDSFSDYIISVGYDDVEDYLANGVRYNMINDDIYDIRGAEVELRGFTARQVYGVYDSEYTDEVCFMICWIFEDDGAYRYIAAEGPYSDIMAVRDYVENTYTTP